MSSGFEGGDASGEFLHGGDEERDEFGLVDALVDWFAIGVHFVFVAGDGFGHNGLRFVGEETIDLGRGRIGQPVETVHGDLEQADYGGGQRLKICFEPVVGTCCV